MDEELKMSIKAYDEFTAILAKFSGALETVEKSERSVAAAADAINRTLEMFTTSVQKTGPPLQRAAADTKAKAQADKEAETASKKHKEAVDNLVQALTSLGILAAVKRGLDSVVGAGGGLDQQLGILQGLTGQLRDESMDFVMALDVERKGVTELSMGLNELARSGYDASQSMTALPELAEFSKASLNGIEQAMAPVVTILKTFNKDVSETGRVTDALTMAANKSALGFDDFQLALAMSAGVAKLAGQDYEELIATLSVMRDAGLGASDGGTSLKSALMALMNPTEEAKRVMQDLGIQVYDNQGRMKSWADIVANMQQATAGLTDQSRNLALTTVFGSDGVRAMALSMGRGSEYIRALTEDLKASQGATAALAHEMGDTWTGAMQRTQANLERMKVLIFEDLKGGMTGLLEALDTLIVGFNGLGTTGRVLVEIFAGGVGLVGAMAAVATLAKTTLIPIMQGLSTALATVTTGATTASTALAALGGPVGLALMAVTALAVGVTYYAGAQEKARREEEQRQKSLMDLSGRYEDLQRTVESATASDAERIRAAEEQKRLTKEIGDQFPELVRRWNEHGEAVELDTKRLWLRYDALKANAKAQDEMELAAARQTVADLQRQRNMIMQQIPAAQKRSENPFWWQTLNVAIGGTLAGEVAGGGNVIPTDAGPLAKELATVNEEIDKALANMGRLYAKVYGTGQGDWNDMWPELPTGGGPSNYDPNAGKNAEEAEKKRVAAIREQMDLLRHLIAMDDERVDTAGEQLAWLARIRETLGTTRDLEEAIHKIEVDILRTPLTEQLAAFERRRQIGEVTAREEQQFYEDLLARADELRLTEQERQEYQVQAFVAKKRADQELQQLLLDNYRYQVDLTDASTAAQLNALTILRDQYITDDKLKRQLALDIARLERQLQEEQHDQALAEIEFNAIVQRQTNEQKLEALRQYLATAKDLTIEQERDLQRTIAQMEQQAERENQATLLDIYRGGLEAQKRLQEMRLRQEQQEAEKAKRQEIEEAKGYYEDQLSPLRTQLELLQDQSRELERQNRLLDIQNNIRKVDQELSDVRARRNRVVIERDPDALFGIAIRRTYDEAKERELLEQKGALEKDLADEQERQARERRQEELQLQIRFWETARDARLKTLNEELQALRDNHSEQFTAFNLFWQEKLDTQTLKQELELASTKTHHAALLAELTSYVTQYNAEIAKMQQPLLQTGADLVNRLGGTPAAPGTATPPTTTSQPTTVEVNNYGDHHYNGVDGVTQAGQALVQGARSVRPGTRMF